jgi:hypothetical protein
VLGGKAALERIAPALDQVLAALDLERIPAPRPDEVARGDVKADVVVAEVSKPSPTIAFELGVVTAKGTPVAYLAADGSMPSPVFAPFLSYDPETPAPKLAFMIAKHVDRLLESGRFEPPQQASGEDWTPPYQMGERFEGVVTHADRRGGYLLVNTYGRGPAMLHVSKMTQSLAVTLEAGAIGPGAVLAVEVIGIDPTRKRVLLAEAARNAPLSLMPDPSTEGVARFLRNWAQIESYLGNSLRPPAREYLDGIQGDLSWLRLLRNDIAHGGVVAQDSLLHALLISAKIVDHLNELTSDG